MRYISNVMSILTIVATYKYSILMRPMACTKEIICLGWILWKTSLTLSAVSKFWRMISKSTQLISLPATWAIYAADVPSQGVKYEFFSGPGFG